MARDPRGGALIPTPGDDPPDAEFDPNGELLDVESAHLDPERGWDGINEWLRRLYRSNACHKISVRYHCGKTVLDMQLAVNGADPEDSPNLNNTTPAAPSGDLNIIFQQSGSDISAYVDVSALVALAPLNTYVVGPASATDNAITLYDGTTGKQIKNSALTSDGNTLSVPGVLTTGAGRVKEIVEFDGASITLDATFQEVVVSSSADVVLPDPAVLVKYTWDVINVSGAAIDIDRNGFNINGAAADVSLPNGDRAHISWDPRGGGWLVTGSTKLS